MDSTPEEAIAQIKEKNYALCFKGKLGEKTQYTGRILAVGISYSKRQKNTAAEWKYWKAAGFNCTSHIICL